MKIDVVYKLGTGSTHNDLELRYSLRSLSFFRDLGKVYVVGHKPEWIRDIIYIPATDVFSSCKDANLINKLILASQEPEISTTFLNFSDDQVLLKECNYEDFIVPLYDNSLIDFKPDQKLSRWKTRLKNTITTLKNKGLPTNCYETHIPTLINKFDFTSIMFKYLYSEGQGMCGNTLYFNTRNEIGKIIPEGYAARLELAILDYNELENLCRDRLHFNYFEQSTNDVLLKFLENKFPHKSKYEND